MSNLSLRAIETNENLDKIITNGFAPGEIIFSNIKKKVKFEMKKAKKIHLKNKLMDNIIIKLSSKKLLCKVESIEANEITGNISHITLKPIKKKENHKIPLVFNGYNTLKNNNKLIKVYLPEIQVLGNNLPEYININLKNYINSPNITVKKLQETTPFKILHSEDDTIAVIHEANNISFIR